MNRTMKKLSAVACSLALMMTALAGCAGGSSSSASGSGSSASSGSVPTLTWWLCGGTPANLADGLKVIGDYTEEKIGVRLDIQMADWGDYDSKMNTVINGGDYFDIMFVNNTNYNRFVAQEKFLDITDRVQEEAPALYDLIPPLVWAGTYVGGRSYAVPTYKDSSITQYYVWDMEIAERYGIDIDSITDFAGLDAAFETIKDGEGGSYYPLQLNSEGFNGWLNHYDDLTLGLAPVGVENSDESRTVVSVLEQDDVMEMLTYLHKWFEGGITNVDAPTLSEAPNGRPFFSAQAFPGADVSWELSGGIENYEMVQVYGPRYSTSSIQGSLNAISASSRYPNEALKLLELVNTDSKLRNMLAYGIEGTDFVYTDEENVIERLTDTWTLAGYQQGTFFNLAAVAPNSGDQYDAVRELNEQGDASTCLGFALDISALSTEVSNCNAIYAKYKNDLQCGAYDPAEMVPRIVDELRANGMDTIIAAAQEQIDAYFAAE